MEKHEYCQFLPSKRYAQSHINTIAPPRESPVTKFEFELITY